MENIKAIPVTGSQPDLQETGETRELGNKPTPMEIQSGGQSAEREVTQPSSQGEVPGQVRQPGEQNPEREVTQPSSQEEIPENPRKRLGGAARKRLSKLLKSGIPYETALRTILNEREGRQQQGEDEQSTSQATPARQCPGEERTSPDMGSKRLRSDGSTPEQATKRHCPVSAQTYGDVTGGVRVGIVHDDYPGTSIGNDQLKILQRAIMAAVDGLPNNGPQVRFLECKHRPGWLLLVCADEDSAAWLQRETTLLQPWEGAALKMVRDKELPRPHVYVAYLPDDMPGNRLSPETILARLRKMNHGLQTREWIILHREESGQGQTWTFSVDETSMKELERLNNRPFFGFGRVQFRPKEKNNPLGAGPSRPGRKEGEKPSTSGITGPKGPKPAATARTKPTAAKRGGRAPVKSTRPPPREKKPSKGDNKPLGGKK